MTRHVLLDPSFLIALENRSDPHHQRAKDLDRELFDQHAVLVLVLHWGILLEIGDGYARIGRRGKAQNLFQRLRTEERYQIEPLTQNLLDTGFEIYLSRSDKEWGLTAIRPRAKRTATGSAACRGSRRMPPASTQETRMSLKKGSARVVAVLQVDEPRRCYSRPIPNCPRQSSRNQLHFKGQTMFTRHALLSCVAAASRSSGSRYPNRSSSGSPVESGRVKPSRLRRRSSGTPNEWKIVAPRSCGRTGLSFT